MTKNNSADKKTEPFFDVPLLSPLEPVHVTVGGYNGPFEERVQKLERLEAKITHRQKLKSLKKTQKKRRRRRRRRPKQ